MKYENTYFQRFGKANCQACLPPVETSSNIINSAYRTTIKYGEIILP